MLSWLKQCLETMNPALKLAILSLAVLAGLVMLLSSTTNRTAGLDGETRELTVFCAASMRIPAEQIAKAYEVEFGANILYVYGGSNTLLSQLEISKQGDLYLAADESYLRIAQQKKLLTEIYPLAQMSAVIIVPQENPGQVQTVDDLLRQGVRVALANPEQAAIGKVTREYLRKIGKWESLETRVRENGVFKPTVSDVANDVSLGSVDAGIVWDAVAQQIADRHPSKIQIIHAPELAAGSANVSIGVLKSSKHTESALHFVRYLSAKEQGAKVFENEGYRPVGGDVWPD